MKTHRTHLLFLFLLVPVCAAFGQRSDYDIVKISPAVVHTPDFTLNSGDVKRTGKVGQWLEVEVNFSARPDYTDELQFKYYILFAGKLLEGEVTLVDIPKGRDLYSVMYMSPRAMAKLLDGRPLTGIEIQNVGVQILNKGQLVAEKSFKQTGSAEWWQQMQQTTGMLLNKGETPFAPLFWDRYEPIKPASHEPRPVAARTAEFLIHGRAESNPEPEPRDADDKSCGVQDRRQGRPHP
jgi:hypothetical protein